jgi:hypothetical protein
LLAFLLASKQGATFAAPLDILTHAAHMF